MSALGHKQTSRPQFAMSAIPPKADIPRGCPNVRLGPKTDKVQRSKIRALFDHLISAGDQRLRHVEAQRLCGLEVDGKLNFCSLLDW
jgi:hypothetical protein